MTTAPTPLRPEIPLPEVQMGPDGLPFRATIRSKSDPASPPYVLERAVSGRWMHIDSRCPGWTNNSKCYHVDSLEALNMTMEAEQTTALATVTPSVLAQIDALDEQQVIARLAGGLPEVTAKWVYSFPSGGSTVTGLSIDGVQECARHLATQGEAIEQVWVHMDDQNENEAFFTACAVRYAVGPNGQRVELDRAIRAKRQPKFTKLRNGGEQPNDFWYEVGVAKALRNAVEALLPEAIKQHMIKTAGKANGAAPTPAQRREQTKAAQQRTAAPTPESEAERARQGIIEAIHADLKRIADEYARPNYMSLVKSLIVGEKKRPNGAPDFQQYDEAELRFVCDTIAAFKDPAHSPEAAAAADDEQLPFE